MGNAAPTATREDKAASLRPVNIVRWAKSAEERGVEEEREGMCAKGIKNATRLHGRDGRELLSAYISLIRLTLEEQTMF